MFNKISKWIKNIFSSNKCVEDNTCKKCTCEKSVENNNSAVICKEINKKELDKNIKDLEKTCIDNKKNEETVEKKYANENAPTKVKTYKKTEKIEKKVTNKKTQKNQQKVVKESKNKVEKVSAESQQQEKVEKPKKKRTQRKVEKND